jgi:hypothetical protein
MRKLWAFYAGVIVAVVVTMFTLPIVVVVAAVMAVTNGSRHDDSTLTGGSSFLVRDDKGRMAVRQINRSFSTASVMMPGEPRPRRLLLSQEVVVPDALGRAEGRVRVDAWLLESAADLKKTPIYSMLANGTALSLGDDGLMWVERAGRRSAYGLADGLWLFDSDSPVVTLSPDGESRRLAAVSAAEDDMPTRSVAVIAYATQTKVLRRVLLVADDPFRARALRAATTGMRLVLRQDDGGRRVLELPLAAGVVRLPVKADDIDLAAATVPSGLRLIPFHPWGRAVH